MNMTTFLYIWLSSRQLFRLYTRGAGKSLTQSGRKQAREHVRDARNFSNIEKRAVIKFPPPLQGKAPKEIHTILTETLACFLSVGQRNYQHPCTFGLYYNYWMIHFKGCGKKLSRLIGSIIPARKCSNWEETRKMSVIIVGLWDNVWSRDLRDKKQSLRYHRSVGWGAYTMWNVRAMMLLVMLHPHMSALFHLSSALRAIPHPRQKRISFLNTESNAIRVSRKYIKENEKTNKGFRKINCGKMDVALTKSGLRVKEKC